MKQDEYAHDSRVTRDAGARFRVQQCIFWVSQLPGFDNETSQHQGCHAH